MAKTASASDLVATGLSESFAHHVLAGTRTCSMSVALWLLDTHGLIVPQLDGKTKRELDVLRGMFEASPPSSRRKRSPEEVLRLARAS